MRNAARLLAVILLLSLPLFGQYSWTPAISFADNTAWCATGNCLTSIGGVTVETKAGVDGTIYGLNGAGAVFTYTHAAGWVEAASALQKAGGLAIEHISVGSATNVLAQTSGSNNVYILNSAKTAWTLLAGGGTCTDAEIGADGDIWCLSSGAIFHWVSGTWVNIAGAASSLSVGDAHNVWVANSAGSLFTFNSSGGWSVVSPGFVVSDALNAIAAAGETAIAAIDTSSKIHVSANSGASWSTILGTASFHRRRRSLHVCAQLRRRQLPSQLDSPISIRTRIRHVAMSSKRLRTRGKLCARLRGRKHRLRYR
jgi:hypothetical protein